MTKKIIYQALIFILLLTLEACHSSKFVLPAWLENHRQERLSLFKSENKHLVDQRYIILLGNSITEGFPVTKYFANQPVLNRGIVADHTGIEGHGILQRLKISVFDSRPAKVFLMIGINDLADKIFSPRQIAYGVKLIVQKIQAFNPGIKIYLQSTLLTTGKYAHLNPLVITYNHFLEQTAAGLEISYINLHPHFANESGELRSEYSRDGLHLTDAGYETWYYVILPFLSETAKP